VRIALCAIRGRRLKAVLELADVRGERVARVFDVRAQGMLSRVNA